MARQPTKAPIATARALGQTEVSVGLARLIAGLFFAVLVLVPAVERWSGARPGSAPTAAGPSLSSTLRAVAGAARHDGLLAANRALGDRLHGLETGLEESSVVAEATLPSVQWLQTALLGVGNETALLGRRGWLFLRSGTDHLTGSPFLRPPKPGSRQGENATTHRHPDPRPALLDFARQLEARGIALIVVPVPTKATVHPELYAPGFRRGPTPPLHNPSYPAFAASLEAAGVKLFDPAPVLLELARTGGTPVYLRGDSHWTAAGVERVAGALADAVAGMVELPDRPAPPLVRRPVEVRGDGDLVRALRLPPAAALFPLQTVTTLRVEGPDGHPWRPDPSADVLLLGDSFTNVFSQPELGWGEGAGLAEQLAFHLARPVDRIAINAGGATAARQALARAGEARLTGKRLVIYQLATRELSSGDWPRLELAGPTLSLEAPPRQDLPEGFAVWESNRTGDWRIWTRRLDGRGLAQLSPDEPGRQHCCPHVAPDGRALVYLARGAGRDHYPDGEAVAGELRLLPLDGGPQRVLLPRALTYRWGNRAAVWRDDRRLIAIDGEGRSTLVDTLEGSVEPLTEARPPERACLLDATLRHAVTGLAGFSPYDAERRRIADRQELGGCEPYFSHDGRWGFWIASGGGPVERIDLLTGETSTLLRKNDPRLPQDGGYLYFPMVSRDGRLLAWGASAGVHDHFRANYEIYVAPVDPLTLELTGAPVKVTHHPASDRYPDVFPLPLELGFHRLEAPALLELPSELPGTVEWDFGDGSRDRASVGRHAYREPGVYEVVARQGVRVLRGQVRVEPPRPPTALGAQLRAGGRQIEVHFDEPVRLDAPKVTLESGLGIAGWRLSEDERSLIIGLDGTLTGADRLHLDGVVERREPTRRMPPTHLDLQPPDWPSDRRALVFVFEDAGSTNLVPDPAGGPDRAFPLAARGRARFDRRGAMVLGGGAFLAPEEAGGRLRAAVRTSNELTFEAVVTADLAEDPGQGRILTYSSGSGWGDLTLAQSGPDAVLRMLAGRGPERPEIRLFRLPAGQPVHVAVTYSPGRLTVFRDGRRLFTSQTLSGGFDRWAARRLVFGDAPAGGADWAGTLTSVALYSRVLGDDEIHESFVRSRPPPSDPNDVRTLRLRATLEAVSPTPTLREISPYRQALAVYRYRVEEILSGSDALEAVQVAHWVILDGERQPASSLVPGALLTLTLEPFDANPQLWSHFLSDTLPPAPELPLYFAIEP